MDQAQFFKLKEGDRLTIRKDIRAGRGYGGIFMQPQMMTTEVLVFKRFTDIGNAMFSNIGFVYPPQVLTMSKK